MTKLTRLTIFVLGAGLLALAQKPREPNCAGLYTKGGPIYTGAITELRGNPSRSATLAITEYLRGLKQPNDRIDVLVDHDEAFWGLRGPVWQEQPAVGEKIMVVMSPIPGSDWAECVLDLDTTDAKSVAVIRRMLALDDLPVQQRNEELRKALNDPSRSIRGFASYRLRTHQSPRDKPREQAFNKEAATAMAGTTPERLQAISRLGRDVYQEADHDNQVSQQVLLLLSRLTIDSDPIIRGEAITTLNSRLFAHGQQDFLIHQIHLAQKDKMVTQLKNDVREQPSYADQAAKLLCLIDPTADSRCASQGRKGVMR